MRNNNGNDHLYLTIPLHFVIAFGAHPVQPLVLLASLLPVARCQPLIHFDLFPVNKDIKPSSERGTNFEKELS
jgi:hypothetical protein